MIARRRLPLVGPCLARGLCLMGLCLTALAPAAHAAPASPLSAVDVGSGTLLLHRVAADGHGVEGFVIDADRLRATLESRVLAERGLGELVRLSAIHAPVGPADVLEAREDGYELLHTFAAPFDALSVRLTIASLAEPDAGSTLYLLSALVGVCLAVGLWSLYRMAATQVAFAQRRNDFVSAVSHELKTPLTAIRMHAEMLQDGLVDGKEREQEYHRTITRESERLSRLIGNVLELSRLERQKPAELSTGDVRPIVREAAEMLRPHAERSGHDLQLKIPEGLPHAVHDPDGLRQVIVNLVENALKYARDADDRRVELECGTRDGRLEIRVRDHGPGVAPHHLPSLFEPFYRGERELTRKHPGTGIGLALVHGLVTEMGGRVTAKNLSPGFEVCLTLRIA